MTQPVPRRSANSSPPVNRPATLPAVTSPVTCPLLAGPHEQWIRCCTARFLPLALRITANDATARDALQESWICVLNGVHRHRGRSPACAWVATIVRHEAAHEAMREARYTPSDFCDAPAGSSRAQHRNWPPAPPRHAPEQDAHYRHLLRIVLELLDALPRTHREIIQLRDLRDISPDAVAAQLHISRSSVSSRLNRAHALLRHRLLRRLGVDGSPTADPPRKKTGDRSALDRLFSST